MPADAPVKVVMDCSAADPAATVAVILSQAAEAARSGDVEGTNALFQRATEAAAAPSVVQVVPLDEGELAQFAIDQAAHAANTEAAVGRAWVELRMKRDRWLAQTDAFFVAPLPSDFPADKVKAIAANVDDWKSFRQALRDLPANTDDPSDAVWPPVPAAPQIYLT